METSQDYETSHYGPNRKVTLIANRPLASGDKFRGALKLCLKHTQSFA